MDSELKQRREQFVHGHLGGSFGEVVAVTSLLTLSHVLFSSFLFAYPILINQKYSRIRSSLDFLLNIGPFLLAITIFESFIYHLLFLIILVIFLNFRRYIKRHKLKFSFPLEKSWTKISLEYEHFGSRLPYVSNLMSSLLLATSIAIMAVDFPIFDRRFAKTEMYGWSLMDVGVGGFIAINGALAAESRLIWDSKVTRFGLIWKAIKSGFPLLIIGLIRLCTVKELNYQEHVTEYGVHWNFFFTIAFTKLISSILCCILPVSVNLFFVSILISAINQVILTYYGLTEYILHADRSNLISANKEGLISLTGSVCLYLFFVQIGRNYLPKRKVINDLLKIIRHVAVIAFISTTLMFSFHQYVEQTSRRETNFAFICFIIAFVSVLILIEISYFIFLHILSHQIREQPTTTKRPIIDPLDLDYQSPIFESIGRRGLLMFLASNLMTGAVNFTVDTISITSSTISLAILISYCAVLIIICQILQVTLNR